MCCYKARLSVRTRELAAGGLSANISRLPSSFFAFANFPTDPKISTLTPNGHLDLPPALIHGETVTFALGSRKNSVISLGRANLEQKAAVSSNRWFGRQKRRAGF